MLCTQKYVENYMGSSIHSASVWPLADRSASQIMLGIKGKGYNHWKFKYWSSGIHEFIQPFNPSVGHFVAHYFFCSFIGLCNLDLSKWTIV